MSDTDDILRILRDAYGPARAAHEPPISIDYRPRDDDGTPYEVPMRRKIGPEAPAPRLPPDMPSSLEGLMQRYGRLDLDSAIGQRESTNVEDHRGDPPLEYYPTEPITKTRAGTSMYLDAPQASAEPSFHDKYRTRQASQCQRPAHVRRRAQRSETPETAATDPGRVDAAGR